MQSGDTCFSIIIDYDSSITAIKSFNPTLNDACSNLIAGEDICLEPAAGNYTPNTVAGATNTKKGSYAICSVTPPGPTPFGTTDRCGKYYQVLLGDKCGQISINNAMTVDLFQAINPSINERCTNLIPDMFYCVSPMTSWNHTNSGSKPSVTVAPPAPTGPGTSNSCYRWHTVKSGDYWALIESTYGIAFEQLQAWNTGLDDTCSNLVLDQAYCVQGPSSATTTGGSGTATNTPTTTLAAVSTPTPIQNDMTTECKDFYQAKNGDYCYLIYSKHGISQEDFIGWNSGVGSDCSQIWLDYWYCVGV